LAGSAPNPVAGSSQLTLLRKKLCDCGADHSKKEVTKIPHITTESNKIQAHWHIFDEDEDFECLEHYYLEKVQERLDKCDIFSSLSKKNLVDIMIMLSMRPADIAGLSIEKYDTSDEMWYKSNYSWYCTGYSKIKGETGSGEPDLFSQWKKIQYKQKSCSPGFRMQYQKNSPFYKKIVMV